MSLLDTYQEAKQLHERQKALAPYEGLDPNKVQNQLRLDISPFGLSVGTVSSATFRFLNNYPCESYRASVNRAIQEIKAGKFLKSGTSLIMTLWPDDLRLDAIGREMRQSFSSVSAMDKKLQISPQEFRLDGNYSYRVLTQGWPQAECVGLRLDGLKALENAVPEGVLVRRYWGPLAALDALMSHFYSVFIKDTVMVAMLDMSRVHYFKLEKGMFSGVRIADRVSIKNLSGFKKVIQDFKMPKEPQVYVIDLAAESHDTNAFCAEASQQEHAHISLVDRPELMEAFSILSSAGSSPLFPLAMLEGTKDGRF